MKPARTLFVILLLTMHYNSCGRVSIHNLPKDISGRIITTFNWCAYSIDLQSQRRDSLRVCPNSCVPQVMTVGPLNTVVLKRSWGGTGSSLVPTSDQLLYLRSADSIWVVDTTLLSGHFLWCLSLDYNPNINQYLMTGIMDSLRGAFVFDSTLKVIAHITHPTNNFSVSSSAFLLSDTTILMSMGGETYMYFLNREALQHLSPHSLLKVDRTRQRAILVDRAEPQFFLMDLNSMEESELPLYRAADNSDATFSSNGRFVAYWSLTGLSDLATLTIYDLSTGIYYETRHHNVAELFWID